MLLPRLTAILVKLICAVVLAMHCGQAAAHPFDGSEVANLSGKVKRIVADPGNGLVVTYNFDQDLRLTKASFQLAKQNQDPSWPRTMKFDYQGGLKLSALLSHPDGFALRTTYAYNDNRQCTAEVTTYNAEPFTKPFCVNTMKPIIRRTNWSSHYNGA